jgi:transcriptional regulator with XRE-family HTH domain
MVVTVFGTIHILAIIYQGKVGVRKRMSVGARLKEFRSRLGFTTRQVAAYSQQFAKGQGSSEYYISNAWLTKIENSDSIPSIHKLLTLSVIYQVPFSSLVQLFGIDLGMGSTHRLDICYRHSQLLRLEPTDLGKSISFPIRLVSQFDAGTTNLLSRMVDCWSEIPLGALQHLDLRKNHYGLIGAEDHTLYPMIRPGSFVQIDPGVRKIHTFRWRTEFDRPIYFVELRNRYACGWCELHGRELTLIPHPLSPCGIQRFEFPAESEIVGQVTGVAMRIVNESARNQKYAIRP